MSLIYHNTSKSFSKLCPKGYCKFPLGDKRLWHSQIIQHIICHRFEACSFKAVFRSTLASMQCLGKYIPPIAKCAIVLLLTQCCFCAHVKALALSYVTLFMIKKTAPDDWTSELNEMWWTKQVYKSHNVIALYVNASFGQWLGLVLVY